MKVLKSFVLLFFFLSTLLVFGFQNCSRLNNLNTPNLSSTEDENNLQDSIDLKSTSDLRVPNLPAPLYSTPLFTSQSLVKVENSIGEALSKTWPKTLEEMSVGAAGPLSAGVFQFPSSDPKKFNSGQAIFVIPPNQNSYTKVIFEQLNVGMNPKWVWNIQLTMGIALQENNPSDGVNVSIVAEGDKIDPNDPVSELIFKRKIDRNSTKSYEIPLGLFPLRRNFKVSILVNKGQNSDGDHLIIDDLRLVARFNRPELGLVPATIAWSRTIIEANKLYNDCLINKWGTGIDAYCRNTYLTNPGVGILQSAEEKVDAISDLKAKWIRVDIRNSDPANLKNVVAGILEAKSRGLKVLLYHSLDVEDYNCLDQQPALEKKLYWPDYNPLTDKKTPGPKLSMFNSSCYTKRLTAYFDAITAKNTSFDALEVGNELDMIESNGDILQEDTWTTPITNNNFTNTVKAYARMLKDAHDLVKEKFPQSNIKIITFGGGAEDDEPCSSTWCSTTGKLNLAYFIKALRSIDSENGSEKEDYISKYVNGIGLHIYPDTGIPLYESMKWIYSLYTEASVTSKTPIWITEWNILRDPFNQAYVYDPKCKGLSCNGLMPTGAPRYQAYRRFLGILNSIRILPIEVAILHSYDADFKYHAITTVDANNVFKEYLYEKKILSDYY